MAKRLVLFDIDETLVYSDGVGRRSLESAMSQVLGRGIELTGLSLSGKTDPQICREALACYGMNPAEIAASREAIFDAYVEILAGELKIASVFGLHAGVESLLQALGARAGVFLGLLTGNLERSARLKLEPFALNRFFPIGAYGSDAADRLELPGIAHRRAQDHFQEDFSADDIVIIGDAVNDVLCARGYGARSIAVSTGKTPAQALAELKPDYLLDGLEDTAAVVKAILA